MKILIADDNEDMQLLLAQYLRKWGHEPTIVANGKEALQTLENTDIQFLISDWSMPEMSGIDLCKAVRERLDKQRYVYIILLTARQGQEDLVEGMEAGADDFVRKPFNKEELRVRIRAGLRTIEMEKTLAEKNAALHAAQTELQEDLAAAAMVQRNLLPDTAHQPFADAGFRFDWIYSPAAFLGGDTYNFFRLNEHHAGFYMIDVAGHGIPAALRTVMLHQTLSAANGQAGLLKDDISYAPHCYIRPPAEALYVLNNNSQDELSAMHYFTMIYGVIDTQTGKVSMSQAGHPPAIHIQQGGSLASIDAGGVPIGMLDNMTYDEQELTLEIGERLVLYTDGITECENADGIQFGEKRLRNLLTAYHKADLDTLTHKIYSALAEWRGSETFDDDVSLLVIERTAPQAAQNLASQEKTIV